MQRFFARLVALAAVVCLLGGSLACETAMANGAWGFARVNNPNPTDRLNLRAAPKSDAASLGLYYNGAQVDVITKIDSVWWQVDCYGRQGYMQGKYLMLEEYHADSLPKSAMPQGSVFSYNGGQINLRRQPSENAEIVRKFSGGRSLQVLGICEEGKWLHVIVAPTSSDSEGGIGFMMANFVNVPGGLRPVSDPAKKPISDIAFDAYVNNPDPADRLNLRAAPQNDAASMGLYYNGVEITALEQSDAQWWKVNVWGRIGYMQAKYLKRATGPNTRIPTNMCPIGTVSSYITADRVNLRAQPNETATQLGKVYSGTEIIILGVCEGGKWLHVTIPGQNDANATQTGFVMAQYIDVPGGIRPVK